MLTDIEIGNATSYTYGKYKSGLIHTCWLENLAVRVCAAESACVATCNQLLLPLSASSLYPRPPPHVQPDTTYYYQVGDYEQSAVRSFKSNPGPTSYPYKFAITADLGENANAQANVDHLVEATATQGVQMVLCAGDLAYANACEGKAKPCSTWDAFQRLVEPVAGVVPFHINIGNHELQDIGDGIPASSARYRYRGMPSLGRADDALYYSFNAGPIHIINICSFFPGGWGAQSAQNAWVDADLAAIDRAVTPWVMVMVHAPMYNSNSQHQMDGENSRKAYEAKFQAAGVTAVFAGHVHAYQRTYPVVDNGQVVEAGSGISHFTLGDGGASLYKNWIETPDWSAYFTSEWGHAEVTVFNKTTAILQWHRNADNEDVVYDEVVLINNGI